MCLCSVSCQHAAQLLFVSELDSQRGDYFPPNCSHSSVKRSARGPNNFRQADSFLWIGIALQVNTRSTDAFSWSLWQCRRRQVSRETGRPVDTVIVRLLPQLICLPLWRLGLSRPITRRWGLSGSSSSNLGKDSQLLLPSSACQIATKQRVTFLSVWIMTMSKNIFTCLYTCSYFLISSKSWTHVSKNKIKQQHIMKTSQTYGWLTASPRDFSLFKLLVLVFKS